MNHLSDDGLDPYWEDSIDPVQTKKKRQHFTTIIVLTIAGLLSATFAANISLSGGRVEFGQGTFLIRACDQWVAYRLNSNGTNLSGIDLIGLDVKRCAGSQFTIRAFTTGSATPLNIFTGTRADSSTGAADVVRLKVNPTVPNSFACSNAYNTYAEKSVSLVNMAATNVAYSDTFHSVTYETATATYKIGFQTPLATVASVNSITLESTFINSSSPSYTEGSCVQIYVSAGLAAKFFNRPPDNLLGNGNVGTLPLTTTGDSSNINTNGSIAGTGLPASTAGVQLWQSIDFGNNLGSNYGFIAIGYFTPPTTGDYYFWTAADDGSGVWLGSLASALDSSNSRTASNATVNNLLGGRQAVVKRGSVAIPLIANIPVAIRIVMDEEGGGDALKFTWAGPGIAETTNLSQYFTTPTNSSGVLTGNYR